MGCTSSKKVDNNPSSGVAIASDFLAVELRRMTQVPNLDFDGSGSDVVVMGNLLDSNGHSKAEEVAWPVMTDMANPVWNKVSRTHKKQDKCKHFLVPRYGYFGLPTILTKHYHCALKTWTS
jgi:hypothetical protein